MNSVEGKVSWCSWLSRQFNTLKVSGSSPGDANIFFWVILYSFNRRVAVKQQSYSVETNHLVKAFFLYKNGTDLTSVPRINGTPITLRARTDVVVRWTRVLVRWTRRAVGHAPALRVRW